MKNFITIMSLSLLCLVIILTNAYAVDEPAQLPAAVKAARASVAWITYANTRRASGFVIDRGDGKKLIVTAGHVYLGDMVLSARLEGMPHPIPCELVDVNQDLDLMVVSPVEPITAPALNIAPGDISQRQLGDRVWLVGCPGGLELSFQDGFINSNPITAEALHLLRTGSKTSDDQGPQGNTLLIRHNAFSTEGLSGCPLIDNHGSVIGIQSGILPDAKKECFAISSRYLSSMNLKKAPQPFANGPALSKRAKTVPTALQSVTLQSTLPVFINADGRNVDGECLKIGIVPSDAEAITNAYISEPDTFRTNFTMKRVQALLDETSLVAYTNPVFGFRFLAPKGYSCKTTTVANPNGILVTLTDPDPSVASPFNTLSIRAIIATDYLRSARTEWERWLATNGYRHLGDLQEDNFARAAYRRGWTQANVLAKAELPFAFGTLSVRARFPNGKIFGPNDAPVYNRTDVFSGTPVSSSWSHCNYVSEDGPVVHAVHAGICENVVVIVHYQIQKQDLDDLKSGRELSRSFRDRYFIRSSVALY